MDTVKAIGYPGSWFAKVGDEMLPCIHKERINDDIYSEPYVKAGKGKWPKFLNAIKEGKRVVVTNNILKNGEPVRRAGYIEVRKIEDYRLEGSVLTFKLGSVTQKLK